MTAAAARAARVPRAGAAVGARSRRPARARPPRTGRRRSSEPRRRATDRAAEPLAAGADREPRAGATRSSPPAWRAACRHLGPGRAVAEHPRTELIQLVHRIAELNAPRRAGPPLGPPRRTAPLRRKRPLVVPAKLGRHRARDARRRAAIGRAQVPRRQQPEPRTAQQDVADGARLLVARRERGFGEQVGKAGNDLLSELATARGDVQHALGDVAVASREPLVGVVADALHPMQLRWIDRRAERDLLGPARRLPAVALDEPVDGQLRHPPPGRELAAGDRDHPARGLIQLGLARDVDRFAVVAARDQGTYARVCAGDVALAERDAEELVDGIEQVVDVLYARASRA